MRIMVTIIILIPSKGKTNLEFLNNNNFLLNKPGFIWDAFWGGYQVKIHANLKDVN